MEAAAAPAVYEGLEPSGLWAHFAALNAIPRPPGHEAAALRYVEQVAAAAGAPVASDQAGNLVVRVAATLDGPVDGPPAPTVAVQSHLDMVCETAPGVGHDWLTDPVRPRREGDLIYATGTTLGADNGIGAAAALALLTTPGLRHGPLELLFTVQEEVGLVGALALDGSLLTARMLVNLDSEDPRDLIIGSAGARDVDVVLPAPQVAAAAGTVAHRISVTGASGGHSGVQIHEHRANAIKLLAQVLGDIRAFGCPFAIADLAGGTARNAIPRDASALVAVAGDDVNRFPQALDGARARVLGEWGPAEPGLAVDAVITPGSGPVIRSDRGDAAVAALTQLPHGVLSWSAAFPDIVQASCNHSGVSVHNGAVEIQTNVRSPEVADLDAFQHGVAGVAAAAGGSAAATGGYPAWAPAPDAELTRVAARAYQHSYGRSPTVQVIHAGLEAGAIASKVPGMQAISFGPLIVSPHSPVEHVDATTVMTTWTFLVTLLESLASGTGGSGG